MYVLHYYPGNASLFPHMLLRELGVPFELKRVDRENNEQKSPAYLKLNPTGHIPLLVHDGRPIYETVAIALYLADRHPEAKMAPGVMDPQRGDFLKWLMLFTNDLQMQYRAWFYPHEFVSDEAHIESSKAATAQRLGKTFAMIGEHLDRNTYLLGDAISAADLYLFMMTRWGRAMPNPPRNIRSLARHAERIAARPEAQETLRTEGLDAPYV
ncbi:MAG: glutathione S-transferase family protein [Alphaproteobacteria bacterium]|nr:glutathione S-transferase family protein [Alphaproteobacteria bacterium]MBV9542055.1 glutathione S-transferase family protein [Alphaproteobacteria bacterium]MBV9904903.1 glutathione S-transferase family protein [Alphaproteobacteria bacterium]